MSALEPLFSPFSMKRKNKYACLVITITDYILVVLQLEKHTIVFKVAKLIKNIQMLM